MPDKFDPYREALIVETVTEWPDEYHEMDPREKQKIAEKLHADAENAANLEYVRMHTGFCRTIHVTAEDMERVAG